MSFIAWDGSLAIGHKVIDAQHESLVGLINRLHTAQSQGKAQQEIKLVLMELYKYTLFHFNEEEALMRGADYAFYAGHRAEHEKFICALDVLAEEAKAEDSHVSSETFTWLVGWLLDHISAVDRKLVACLQK